MPLLPQVCHVAALHIISAGSAAWITLLHNHGVHASPTNASSTYPSPGTYTWHDVPHRCKRLMPVESHRSTAGRLWCFRDPSLGRVAPQVLVHQFQEQGPCHMSREEPHPSVASPSKGLMTSLTRYNPMIVTVTADVARRAASKHLRLEQQHHRVR